MRNKHTLISMFLPMSYSPINKAERLAIVFVTSGVAYFLSVLLNNDDYWLNFIVVTVPTIITDYLMTYLVTQEDIALLERGENSMGEEDPEECKMRQQNLPFLIATRNERAIVRELASDNCKCGKACVGNYSYRACVLIALALFFAGGRT
eukprot:UN00648